MRALRVSQLLDILPGGRTSLYNVLILRHQFPLPVPLAPAARGWLKHEVDEWYRQQISGLAIAEWLCYCAPA